MRGGAGPRWPSRVGTGNASDVVVIGGGPAGSATAALLAEAGWTVTVVERAVLPRPKPCGECLNPGAVAALGRLGLLECVLALSPATLDGWEVRSGAARARGDFPAGGVGIALARDRLDAALLTAARRRGARVVEGVTVREVGEPGPDGRRALRTREPGGAPGTRHARIVVGADGLRSVAARSMGALRRLPRLRKVSLTVRVRGRRPGSRRGLLVLSGDTTVGVAPVSEGEALWNLTVVARSATLDRTAARAPLAFLLAAAEKAGCDWVEGPEVVAGPWASGPFDWPMRAAGAPGLLLVGDAAGYYDPLTGQGIFRALRSAELAAETIDRALRAGRLSGADARGYTLRHAVAFAPGQAVQRAVEAVLSRGRLRDGFVEGLERRSGAFGAFLGVTGDCAPVRSLLRPSVLAELLLPRR